VIFGMVGNDLHWLRTASGVRRDKAALSSGCKPHPATAPAGSSRVAFLVCHARILWPCAWRRSTSAMEALKVRRLPVINKSKRMIGILSLGDVSHSAPSDVLSECVRNVSAHH
jgi:hypothetical protein